MMRAGMFSSADLHVRIDSYLLFLSDDERRRMGFLCTHPDDNSRAIVTNTPRKQHSRNGY